MKNNIDITFQSLKRRKKKALIAYVTAGYPQFEEQQKLIKILDQSGVDILELGVPFSDPIADGKTIQFSSQESLKNKTSLKKILAFAKHIRPQVNMPFVVMSYLNPILKFGLKKFADTAAQSGISGVIIPDIIIEEGLEIEKVFKEKNIHVIYLVTPTTPLKRQKLIAKRSGGFLYAVSVTGVTGARKLIGGGAITWLKKLSTSTDLPVCVGFGISSTKQIHQFKNSVSGFIVGSAIIDIIRKNEKNMRIKKLGQFANALSKECYYGR